jgi:putative tryptophan/tyrosine transport system substrate-binding protein
MELFKETVPGTSRVGVLAGQGFKHSGLKEYESAAHALKISLQYFEVRGPNPDLEGTFREMDKGRVNALVIIGTRFINRFRKEMVELPLKNRLPSMYETAGYVERGGLMSYSANDIEIFRRAAWYLQLPSPAAKLQMPRSALEMTGMGHLCIATQSHRPGET